MCVFEEIYVTFSSQCSNVSLFGITRLRLSRERMENFLYIYCIQFKIIYLKAFGKWGGGGSAAIRCRVTHVPPHVKVDFSKRFRLPKNILFTQPDENKRVKSKNLFHLRTNICVPGPNKTSWIFSNEKCLKQFFKDTSLRNKCFELGIVLRIKTFKK